MHGTTSAAAASVAIAATCLTTGADAFHSASFAPSSLSLSRAAAAHTALPLRASRPILSAVTMSGEGAPKASRLSALRTTLSKLARNTAASAALALALAAPKGASASAGALAEAPLDLEPGLDEPVTLYEATTIKKAVTLETFGLAGAAAAGVLGASAVVAVRRERGRVAEEVDAFEREAERMEQFKQEFLDGVASDRSLFASLNKAVKSTHPEDEAAADGAVSDDEFERNVQAFLDEENDKAEKAKKKPEYRVEKGGPTLLERPDDLEGGKADEWLEEIGFEDTPAEIDAKQLEALQRMFGG
eukprot:CAMPEP_0173434388 /NCGR_PEP_ID=MMETSP1357-20121228/12757_1 /TAXON_ID=77926 /ORGANISM="Hemiselmis rufescens, Strain PCC563" /LENGTH=302 /DNA_ID=CAMNT_0014399231 /DNA_START=108 /DNA_END=1012 /DNA_ORIENTATION=+